MNDVGRARMTVDPVHRRPSGALQALTVLVVILLAIPSRLIVAPLGAAGTPAEILGVGLGAWWMVGKAMTSRDRRRSASVQVAAGLFGAAVLASYIAATTRVIDAVELRAATMGLISLAAWLGILFMTADGPTNRYEIDTLLRRLCLGGGLLALLGIIQFVTGQPLTNYIQIPGLSINDTLTSVQDRAGLVRPAGTALHPIEFGAVLTTILPLAIHYALTDGHRSALARWFPVAAIAVAVPISISRSAIVSATVGLLFIIPTLSPIVRRKAYVTIVMLVGILYVTVPGLLGTIRGLFTGIQGDSSAQSRTGSYDLAWEFVKRSPLFGRGFKTFLPSYRILDNQYLGALIDIGFIGLVCLLALFATGILAARAVRSRSRDSSARGLAQALAASVAAAGCGFAVYDAFSFPMAASLLFLVLGAVAALRRISANEPQSLSQVRGTELGSTRSTKVSY